MKVLFVLVAAIVTLSAGGLSLQKGPDTEAQIQHGKYLVENVAMCLYCHTPRDEKGNIIKQALFEGAPVPVEPPYPGSEWAFRAPNIVGLRGRTQEDALHLLMTGKKPDGTFLRAPMPPFRMNRHDAESVVAYLKSLQGKAQP